MTFVCTCSFTISNIPAVSYRLSYRHSTLLTFTTLLSHPVVRKLKDTFESQTHIVRRVTEDLSCLSFFPNFVPYYFYLISLYAPFLSPSYSLFLFPLPLSLSFPSPSLSFGYCPFLSFDVHLPLSLYLCLGVCAGEQDQYQDLYRFIAQILMSVLSSTSPSVGTLKRRRAQGQSAQTQPQRAHLRQPRDTYQMGQMRR